MPSECCAYFEGETCVEPYMEHICCMLKVWENISKYYKGGLARILQQDKRKVDELMRIAILTHDAGKLFYEYVKGNRVTYRHEVLSSYVTYKTLEDLGYDEEVRTVVAASVLLHHESGIIGIYAGQRGERIVPLSTIRSVILSSDLSPSCDISKAAVNCNLGGDYVNYMHKWIAQAGSKKCEVYEVVKKVVLGSIGKNGMVMRNKVAAFLHPLTVVDSVAATLNRPHGDDQGTWIARRALKGGAELGVNNVRCKRNGLP